LTGLLVLFIVLGTRLYGFESLFLAVVPHLNEEDAVLVVYDVVAPPVQGDGAQRMLLQQVLALQVLDGFLVIVSQASRARSLGELAFPLVAIVVLFYLNLVGTVVAVGRSARVDQGLDH